MAYLWVPLVPETNGHIDQHDLNAFSMANTLVFSFLVKNPLHLVFGLNKIFSINFWVENHSSISLCLVGEMT